MIKIPASKRLRFSIAVIIVNFLIGGFGIYHVADLGDLGMFLALSNSPLYVYILGDTFRPSNNKKHEI